MKQRSVVGKVAFPVIGVLLATLSEWQPPGSTAQVSQDSLKHFKPIIQKVVDNPQNPVTAVKVTLGKMLYNDPRLSKSGFLSCNTCHNLATYGMSNLPTDIGHKWAKGDVNSPTVLNAAFNVAQFRNGRAKDLEAQAKGPILEPVEMGMPSEEAVVERIKSIPPYRRLFAEAFPDDKEPLTYDNIARAVAAFERTLLTPSRFDKFLLGDDKALSDEEKQGMKLFVEKNCIQCHKGISVGGDFRKLGEEKPYKTTSASKGRFDVTNKPEDMYVFRVPTLRNVEMTYPYFFDGQIWNLDEAIRLVADIQQDVQLKDAEVAAIVAFLKSLTGEIPQEALVLPVLPPSTADTPKPSRD
jgi:cytochrome c peroxidase